MILNSKNIEEENKKLQSESVQHGKENLQIDGEEEEELKEDGKETEEEKRVLKAMPHRVCAVCNEWDDAVAPEQVECVGVGKQDDVIAKNKTAVSQEHF